MDKDFPLDDLREESEKRVTEDDIGKQKGKIEIEGRKEDTQPTINRIYDESRTLATEKDSGRQYAEDKLKGTRDKIDSMEGKLGSSLDGEVSKSEDSSKTGMLPTLSPNRIEALKDEEKFKVQDEIKHLKNADNVKQKFLALEKQVQEDDTEMQNVQIEVEGKEQDVVKGIPEESRMPSMEEDSVRQNEEDELIGTRSESRMPSMEEDSIRQNEEDELIGTRSESRMPSMEEDSIRQNEEDELIGTRSESKVCFSGGFLVEEESKSEEPCKMRPNKSLNRIEALKKEAKSLIQNEENQINSANNLREKLLALESELSIERIQSKTIGIFLPNELKKKSVDGTEIKISELNVTPKRKGISPRMTIIFIIAAATGSAFQYLPFYLKESTWFGVFFVLLLGLNSLYACLCTGWCWSLMEEIWPEYAAWTRIPYQDMAYRAVGPWMKYIVSFLFNVTTLVLCCNYILTLSEAFAQFLYPDFTICHFIIIASIVLAIPVMLGSYRNMKFISTIDVILSFLIMLFIIICLFYDQDENNHGSRDYSKRPTENIIMAFAGISYAFGMGMLVPNIVVEMEDRSKFTESCVTAFMILMAMYTLFAIFGYAAYGSNTQKHLTTYILETEDLREFGITIDVIQALQMATTFTIYIIPLFLSFEEIFKCPERFCLRRTIIRLGTMMAIMVLLLGIPHIIDHLDVIVATFLNILSFLLPPIFHLLLRKQKVSPSTSVLSVKELILVAEILLLGSIIAIVAIYVTVKTVIHHPPNLFSCYLNMSLLSLDYSQ